MAGNKSILSICESLMEVIKTNKGRERYLDILFVFKLIPGPVNTQAKGGFSRLRKERH